MNRPCYYLETKSNDPYYNLAFEEYVLTHKTDADYLMLWQNENTIVIGQNQNTDQEINREFVEQYNINVVRRSTGGGAVYHDMGNLNYSFITDADDKANIAISRFTKPVVEALKELGLQAEANGRNDVVVDGRKVSGTAQRLWKNRILHHGTLLFDSDSEMISGALHVNTEKYHSKGIQSVVSRVGNIRQFLHTDMTMDEFWAFLRTHLCGQISKAELTKEDLEAVDNLKKQKYDTWEWNYGRSPAADVVNRKRFDGGTVEVHLSAEHGCITGVKFYGDFLSRKSLDAVIASLIGKPLRRNDVSEALSQFSMEDFFGQISREDIVDLIIQ